MAHGCGKTLGLDEIKFPVAKTASLEGAYFISTVVHDYLLADVDYGNSFKILELNLTNLIKPSLAANSIIGFLTYGNTSLTPLQVFNPLFFDMKCQQLPLWMCQVDGQ